MSATDNATTAVVPPSFLDAFSRRSRTYEDGKGRTPLYPRADREQLGDQSNPEHEKFELWFRLLDRHEEDQRKLWDGPDHRTKPLSEFVGPDDFRLRFQGKIESGGVTDQELPQVEAAFPAREWGSMGMGDLLGA
jgi:hypothetical protein